MADQSDPKISAAYRGLGAEEPPRALDDAILAASRRSSSSWNKRWAVPLSLAAVVVLSVTVTLRIQDEQPEISTAAPATRPLGEAAADRQVVKEEAAKPAAQRRVAKESVAQPATELRLSRSVTEREVAREEAATPAPVPEPERELERIAGLRGQGRHDEADKALAEFRKRFPDYRIPEVMRERVERR